MTDRFFNFPPAEPDPLWALTAAFVADARPHKIDLGVGVYRDERGQTPVLRSVRQVEQLLAEQAPSKTYRSLAGNTAFNAGMSRLLLGPGHVALERCLTRQSVGGTGALRLLAELIAAARPGARVWLSDPGYVNHRPIMEAAGLGVAEYPWREVGGSVDLGALLAGLDQARPGDVLLLQGCCHNPTGIDPAPTDWQALADFCRDRQLLPLVDMAYQGLGEGMDEDAAGLRLLAGQLDTVLVASSCSKNMGLYCERTGAVSVIVRDPAALPAIAAVLEGLARRDYSMPPEHGAAIAAALMARPELWLQELAAMRVRIRAVRAALAAELAQRGASPALQAVARHRGMFSTLPLDAPAMARLRETHAIYGTASGRINLAGLTTAQAAQLADALMAVAAG